MKFEIGKTYLHSSGKKMAIIGRLKTHAYGVCLVGEDDEGKLYPVGENEENALNWCEVIENDTKESRKGHWIFDGDCLICSKCKKAYTFSGSNFCPACGADMRESEKV